MGEDGVVLSYGDSLVRQSDLAILASTQWLTDTIISFYFEYCSTEVFPAKEVCWVGPEVAQLVKLMPEAQLGPVLDPLELRTRRALLLPVNSNTRPDQAGGSHWSLLVCLNPAGARPTTFLHLDSARGFNKGEARALAGRLASYLGVAAAEDCSELEVPQQTNGYDCGLHCLAMAESVARQVQAGQDPGQDPVLTAQVPGMRAELTKLLLDLAARQNS